MQDRLWFHTAARYNRAWNYTPSRFNLNAGNADLWTYEPDLTGKPASNRNTIRNGNARVTWQASPRNKLAGSYDRSLLCDCPRSLTAARAPEANVGNYVEQPRETISLEWTAPLSNRLLLESNFVRVWQPVDRATVNPYFPPSPVELIEVQDQGLGNLRYRGTSISNLNIDIPKQFRAVMLYITGSHSLRVGMQHRPVVAPDAEAHHRRRGRRRVPVSHNQRR